MEGNRIEKRTDLLRGVTLTRLDRLFAEGDKGAHKFVIGLTLGNSVVTLDSGATVTGHFIRADDSTLPPIKGTVEEGKAVLTLPEGAYKITGYFSLIIKANVGEMSCAVFWGDGAITRTSTDTIVDHDHTIPSLDELLTKIAAIDDAIARADAAAEEARQAAQSANFTVLDHYETLNLLKAAHPTGNPGDAYAIGTEEPYDVHIWGVDVKDWVNIGQLQGAQGLQGVQGPAGADGVSPTISIEAIDGGNRVTITDANGTQSFDVLDGKEKKYGQAVFFGDSITQGVGNNDYSYVDILAESGAFESVKKHGVGGACIHPDSDVSLSEYALINQINRYEDDVKNADVVFIEYGGNDMFRFLEGVSFVNQGLSTDTSTTDTVCGYALKAIERVKELNPSADILWLQWNSWKPDEVFPVELPRGMHDFMLYQEATLYRLARNAGLTIIDIGANLVLGDPVYYTDDRIHPNTAGHKKAAQTLLSNMYNNSTEGNLYRIYEIKAVDAESLESAEINGDFSSALALLMAGGVDVSLNVVIAGAGCIHYKVAFFSEGLIAFHTVTDNYGEIVTITAEWMSDGSIVYK